MSRKHACEKCWGDAYLQHRLDPSKSQVDHYLALLLERRIDQCSKDEQLGQWKCETCGEDCRVCDHRDARKAGA